MMKKNILLSVFLGLGMTCLMAQSNVIKVNPLGLAANSVTLGYERVIGEKQAFAVHVNMLLGVPGWADRLLEEELSAQNAEGTADLSGIAITPQYRFYTGKKGAPRGFYIAPYLRYTDRTLEATSFYEGDASDLNFNLSGIGGGVQLGVQWLIGGRVALDWYFLGLGANYSTFNGVYTADNMDEIELDIREDVNDLPIIGDQVEISRQGNELTVTIKTMLPAFRSGLSLGLFF